MFVVALISFRILPPDGTKANGVCARLTIFHNHVGNDFFFCYIVKRISLVVSGQTG